MPPRRTFTKQFGADVIAYAKDHSRAETAEKFGISTGTVTNMVNGRVHLVDPNAMEELDAAASEAEPGVKVVSDYRTDSASVAIRAVYPDDDPPEWMDNPRHMNVHTLGKALEAAHVDMKTWEVSRWKVTFSEVTVKLRHGSGAERSDEPQTYTNCHLAVWLARKSPEAQSLELLLDEVRDTGAPVIRIKRLRRGRAKHRRELELSIMDPHLGLRSHAPAADADASVEQCKTIVMEILDDLIEHATARGPFERVIFPFGNDFLHSDTIFHTTTAGTPQPESESWQYIYLEGEKLAIAMVERMRLVAPVVIYTVPGNHDRQSAFTLGRLLHAYYHKARDVTVHADSSPYKFHRFGKCLIGFEHGHSIRQAVRLAALMANETRINGWAEARYCEWHLGDQHRKGSARPNMLEEQGVSIEFLPGLTPPNEWHRLKGYNWQKRAGVAFVWDHDRGLTDRYFVNIDNYTQKLMGKK